MHPPTDLQDVEAALEAEGDEGALHARLLLWYMRKVMQVQDYDEYEYVFDADAGGRRLLGRTGARGSVSNSSHLRVQDRNGSGDDQAIAAWNVSVTRSPTSTSSGLRPPRRPRLARRHLPKDYAMSRYRNASSCVRLSSFSTTPQSNCEHVRGS